MKEASNDPTLRATNALNSLRPNASAETIATAAAAAGNYGNIAGCVLDHCPADTCAEVESYILSFQPAWDKHVLPKAGIDGVEHTRRETDRGSAKCHRRGCD